jgi:hypothetical protein
LISQSARTFPIDGTTMANRGTPPFEASLSGDLDLVSLLLKSGANMETETDPVSIRLCSSLIDLPCLEEWMDATLLGLFEGKSRHGLSSLGIRS